MNTKMAFNTNFDINLASLNTMSHRLATLHTTKRGDLGTPMMGSVHGRGQSTRFGNTATL